MLPNSLQDHFRQPRRLVLSRPLLGLQLGCHPLLLLLMLPIFFL
jgi:hypothetical protein